MSSSHISLDAVFGHEAPVRILTTDLAEGRVGVSYLLVGPQGVGKTTLALAFAEAAACSQPQVSPGRACGQCRSCRYAQAGTHPEVALIAPAGDQTQIWQFWDRDGRPPGVLQRALAFEPSVGRRRVFIVERAETLTEPAANSLLKALEEPPSWATFLLLTPNPTRMLPTILSRCRSLRLLPVETRALAGWLERRFALDPERALLLARLTEGRPGAAVTYASDPAALDELDSITTAALGLVRSDPLRALKGAEEFRAAAGKLAVPVRAADDPAADDARQASQPRSRSDRGRIAAALDVAVFAFRDLLAARMGGAEAEIVHVHRRGEIEACAAKGGPERWTAALDALLLARRRIDQNVPPNLVTDWLAVTIAVA